MRRIPEQLYGAGPAALSGASAVGPKGEGRFERISWDEALDLAAARLREARERWGGESILPFSYGGSNGLLTQDTTDARLFRRLGASRLARTVCAAPPGRAATGLYGKMPGVALPDYVARAADRPLGGEPLGLRHPSRARSSRRRSGGGAAGGGRSRARTPLAKQADLHLAPRPGDRPAARARPSSAGCSRTGARICAFLAEHATGAEELRRRAEPWTFERAAEATGVPAADIERFARLYAESSPAVIRCGWGLERNRNGGSAVAAVLALPAVAGKFGVRGGGYTMSNSGRLGARPARRRSREPRAADPRRST